MRHRCTLILGAFLVCSPLFAQQPSCPTSATVNLTAPADNASVTSPVTFSWDAVSNATAYRIWIIVDNSPSIVLDRVTKTSMSEAVPSGAVEWYVEALAANCPSVFSDHRHLTVSRSTTCDARKAAVPTAPINGVQVASPVTFTWTGVTGALFYRLWISVDGSAFVDVDETKLTTLTEDVPPGSVQWYVDAVTEGCPTTSSAKATFVVPQTSACTTVAPVPITPPSGSASVVAPVTFSWSPVPNATAYRIIASVDGSDFFFLGKTTDTSFTKVIPPGSWIWFVDAVLDECDDTRSSRSRFTIVKAANCPTNGPVLVAPANNAQNVASPVTFDWNPVPGAIGYGVFAKHNDGPSTQLAETTATQLQRKLPEGAIEWFVVAVFAACPPVESSHNMFTVAPQCDNRRPVLVVPHDGAVGLTSPVQFAWSRTPNAKSYNLWLSAPGALPVLVGTTTDNHLTANVAPGETSWYVEAVFDSCSTESSPSTFVARMPPPCGVPGKPLVRSAGQAASGSQFAVRWTAIANASSYELQEATINDFSNATTQVISGVIAPVSHAVTKTTRYYYRVRALSSCNDARGAYSRTTSTVVLAPSRNATIDIDAAAGTTQTIQLPAQNPPVAFTATADKPWVTVTPKSGTVGTSGATLTVTTDRNALLSGTNAASIKVTYTTTSPGRIGTNGTTNTTVPISVSVATPVASSGKSSPPPDALIIPAISHTTGLNGSSFSSDVRVANISTNVQRYQLNFTFTRTDGTLSGSTTTIEVDPGSTFALNDILNTFFGIGTEGLSQLGTLEIRNLSSTGASSSSAPSVTIASSRTFDTAATGTFGEFIPAIPFSQFITNTSGRLSLQHVVQSSAYRTNLGLVEGAGEAASVLVHVFDDSGNDIAQIPIGLQPDEHRQITSFLQANALSLNDGRFEVEVTSTTGNVSAYASVVDNATNDAYLVPPASKSGTSATRFILPDVEENTATAKRSDVRLFNAGSTSATATLAFSAQPGMTGASKTVQVTIPAGQVKSLDDILQSQFGLTASAGALLATTSSSSNLIVSGRTYTQTTAGTYGQFTTAATPAQSVGAGDRTLQLLQLEDSDAYKTSIGIAETSGKSATIEISVIQPDAKAIPKVQIPIDPNGFQQINLASFGLGNLYNARVTVKVVSGSGKITAYGSLVDQQTLDPTYVPAQ